MLGKSKHFVGSAPSKWLTLAPACSKTHCRTIRHADDLEYYVHEIPWAGSIILRICQQARVRPHITSGEIMILELVSTFSSFRFPELSQPI